MQPSHNAYTVNNTELYEDDVPLMNFVARGEDDIAQHQHGIIPDAMDNTCTSPLRGIFTAAQHGFVVAAKYIEKVPELIKFVAVSIFCVVGLVYTFPFSCFGPGGILISPDGGVPWTLVLFSVLFTIHFWWFVRARCNLSLCWPVPASDRFSLAQRLFPGALIDESDGSWKPLWPGYVPPIPSRRAFIASLSMIFLSCAWLWVQVLILWLQPPAGSVVWTQECISYNFRGRSYNPGYIFPGNVSSRSPERWQIQYNIGMSNFVGCALPSAPSLQNAILCVLFSNVALLGVYGLAFYFRPVGNAAAKVIASREALERVPLSYSFLHYALFGCSMQDTDQELQAVDDRDDEPHANSRDNEPHANSRDNDTGESTGETVLHGNYRAFRPEPWHGTVMGWSIVVVFTIGYVTCVGMLIFFPTTWLAYYSGPDSHFLVWTLSASNNRGGPLPISSIIFVGLPVLIASVPTAVLFGQFLVNRPITTLDICINRLKRLFLKLQDDIMIDGVFQLDRFREHAVVWYDARKHMNDYDNMILMRDVQGTLIISILIMIGMCAYLVVNILSPFLSPCDDMETLETSVWGGGCFLGSPLSQVVVSGFTFLSSLATSSVIFHRLILFVDLSQEQASFFQDIKLKLLHSATSEEHDRAISAIDFSCERILSTSVAPRVFGVRITRSTLLFINGVGGSILVAIITLVSSKV